MEMRKIMLVAAALTAGALGLNQAMAQQTQKQGSAEEMKVTGMVTEADQQTNEITIGDKKFVMPEEGGGASMFPQVGAEVTVFYEEQDGKNVITRIGQAQ
jgi:hypothetical protein